jgi:hypothetical protein
MAWAKIYLGRQAVMLEVSAVKEGEAIKTSQLLIKARVGPD